MDLERWKDLVDGAALAPDLQWLALPVLLGLAALALYGLWPRPSREPGLEAGPSVPVPIVEALLAGLGEQQFAAVLQADGRVLHASAAALQAWGLLPGGVKGRFFGDLPVWSSPPESRHRLNKLLLQAATGQGGKLQIDADGARGALELTLVTVPGLPYIVCTARAAAPAASRNPASGPEPPGPNKLVEELAALLPAARDPEEACQISKVCLLRLFPNSSGILFLSRGRSRGLESQVQWGPAPLPGGHLGHDDCWGLRRGGIHRVELGEGSLCCAHAPSPAPHPRGYACVPLSWRGESVGLLHLSWSDPADAPAAELLQAVAAAAAPSLSHVLSSHSLREQANRDGLTGLLNRRALDESLPQLIQRAADTGRPLSLALFDVDHFKLFNDRYGHEAGDLVLRSVGQKLTSGLREGDLAFRYGGEEFVIVLPGSGSSDAWQCIERLRRSIADLALSNRGERLPTVTASAGIAECPGDGADAESLLKRADQGLYCAKAAGRDRLLRHHPPVSAAA